MPIPATEFGEVPSNGSVPNSMLATIGSSLETGVSLEVGVSLDGAMLVGCEVVDVDCDEDTGALLEAQPASAKIAVMNGMSNLMLFIIVLSFFA